MQIPTLPTSAVWLGHNRQGCGDSYRLVELVLDDGRPDHGDEEQRGQVVAERARP